MKSSTFDELEKYDKFTNNILNGNNVYNVVKSIKIIDSKGGEEMIKI